MKWMTGLLVLCMLSSCTEESKPTAAARPVIVAKDSNLITRDSAANPYAPVDLSPMDMSYFPADYPVQKMSGTAQEEPVARVIYSRPQRQGRTIFGSLIKYGQPWRLGANEGTEIEFFRAVTIMGKRVAKGKYMMYSVPGQKEWILILNSRLNSWGLNPNTEQDVQRFTVPAEHSDKPIEYFSMIFQEAPGGANLVMAWDTVIVKLPIQTR